LCQRSSCNYKRLERIREKRLNREEFRHFRKEVVMTVANLPKKVLVADDKATSRELVRTILEQTGHVVYEAANGMEAVRRAREVLPDLILLDLHMPALDGFGALRELKEDEKFGATPIVALTASAMQGDRERALAAGFTGYIAKPISLNELRSEIERLLV
jgi:CheY-like chemotaxis protein